MVLPACFLQVKGERIAANAENKAVYQVKTQFTLRQAMRYPEGRDYRCNSALSVTSALVRGVGDQDHAVVALPLGKASRYQLYRRLGEPQGQYGRVWKTSPLTRIRPSDRPAGRDPLH